jgi:CRP/FNR family transcriptional regulator
MADLDALYPSLAALDPAVRREVLAQDAQQVAVPAGTVLFDQGNPCRGFPMVLAGEVRVSRGSVGGRHLELYRVLPGELCVVSTASLFGHSPMTAQGIAAQPTELLMLSPEGFERWIAHEPFRRFVFGVFADRLTDLLQLAEAVAFQRMDQRLAAALLGHGPTLHLTHQNLADEIGTVREIVTRLLRRFERAGHLRLARERIEILDAAALRLIAGGAQ